MRFTVCLAKTKVLIDFELTNIKKNMHCFFSLLLMLNNELLLYYIECEQSLFDFKLGAISFI